MLVVFTFTFLCYVIRGNIGFLGLTGRSVQLKVCSIFEFCLMYNACVPCLIYLLNAVERTQEWNLVDPEST